MPGKPKKKVPIVLPKIETKHGIKGFLLKEHTRLSPEFAGKIGTEGTAKFMLSRIKPVPNQEFMIRILKETQKTNQVIDSFGLPEKRRKNSKDIASRLNSIQLTGQIIRQGYPVTTVQAKEILGIICRSDWRAYMKKIKGSGIGSLVKNAKSQLGKISLLPTETVIMLHTDYFNVAQELLSFELHNALGAENFAKFRHWMEKRAEEISKEPIDYGDMWSELGHN